MKTKWILFLLAAAGGVAFYVLHPPKKTIVNYLIKKYNVDYTLAMAMEYGYLHGRYRATKQGKDKYTFKGKQYWTINGKAV